MIHVHEMNCLATTLLLVKIMELAHMVNVHFENVHN